ncbi:MAG: hypothetical protein KUG82_12100 [Pseudomonadales bacterium]|nr:hypothetical protein [Pseudomonadales bacterium]
MPQHLRLAKKHNLQSQIIHINGFQLQTFANQAYIQNRTQPSTEELHIYIEGDGHAWTSLHVPSKDPTPKVPIMLDLMTLDTVPSIYVGRPCYYSLKNDHQKNDSCNVLLWTFARYGEEVLRTLTQAYTQLGEQYQSLALIGHSGGGTLAMLIAPRLSKTQTVITLAGNLDTDSWTQHHQYSPLHLSLNPAKQPRLPQHIQQIHYSGDADKNVLPVFIKKVANREKAQYKTLDGYDHSCCWEQVWPAILDSIMPNTVQRNQEAVK